MTQTSGQFVWVFNGAKSNFPSAIFSQRPAAEEWIRKHGLTGILTAYPVDVGVYEWAVERGHFFPSKDGHKTAQFIGKFSSASQEHYHFELGVLG